MLRTKGQRPPTSSWARLQAAAAGALVAFLAVGVAVAECVRTPLPEQPNGAVVDVDSVRSLRAALRKVNTRGRLNKTTAKAGASEAVAPEPVTIRLAPGRYQLSRPLVISGSDVTVRGATGNRDDVVIVGEGMAGRVSHVFAVGGDRVTLANLSAGEVHHHVVQVRAEKDADDFRAHNVRLFDAAQQIMKVSYRRDGPQSDRGVIEWSVFEFTAGHAHQAYTGGLGALGAKDWVVRDSVFRNIRVPPGSRPAPATAIMFRRASEGTRIERNRIINSDSGIRLGLSDGSHGAGLIENNWVHTVTDVGIALEKATGVVVSHNTLWGLRYPSAIEYRFPSSVDNRIENNLLGGVITRRDGAKATVRGNVTFAEADWFKDANEGNLGLLGPQPEFVDRAANSIVTADGVCAPRPLNGANDVGAEEWRG